MQITDSLWLFLLIFVWLQSCMNIHSVSSQCLDDHKSLLLDFLSNLVYNRSVSTKLTTWNRNTDCCKWNGVKCDNSTGRVIGLDLSHEAISHGIDNSSSLFFLQSLQSLNLADNPISETIPSKIGDLSSLTYLDLSNTSFRGQVPIEMSNLVKLVVLDLSMPQYIYEEFSPLHIRNHNLGTILQNMSNLKELYLDGIAISNKGDDWGEAISSSLPRLQVLSLMHCNLTANIPRSISKLRYLSEISLDFNNFSAPVPSFLAGFRNLTMLTMNLCELIGIFPHKIFEVPTLTTLQLQGNKKLQGTLPQFIGKKLVTLDISFCNFNGTIPSSLGTLDQLEYVDLSTNNFSGPVPSFFAATNLYFLQLSENLFTGSIPRLSPTLQYLTLRSNSLEGAFPNSILQLKSLEVLDLSWNRFNGTVKLHEILNKLGNIQILYLSYNLWSIDTNGTSDNSSFPLLGQLGLASTNLHVLPEFIATQPYLYIIDVSNNQIQGKVPTWIWNDGLYSLNLSCNSFTEIEQPIPSTSFLQVLDLHSNNLSGQIPAILSQKGLQYLDWSNNSFSSINPNIGSSLAPLLFLSLSKNKIHGRIPTSICNAKILEILNLESNYLHGTIPRCLMGIESLVVLNLRGNNFHGTIPDEFSKSCALETLNFNSNFFQGQIPRSFANCKELKVLDLGNNQLNDTFPCHLKSLPNLQVLVLRSNKLHGTVLCSKGDSWPLLQIIDLASNHFNDSLSPVFLGNWRIMMAKTSVVGSKPNFLQYNGNDSIVYYQDKVSVTFKGLEFELQKILMIFTSIDLSNNAFYGEIPKEFGSLIALKVLNLSYNSFLGKIPPSIGNLSQLESLDLSHNALRGHIPQQLANLNFLEFLNLSYNRLSGKIPKGTQLQLFDESSYEGNLGLYGSPLTHESGFPKSHIGSDHMSLTNYMELMLQGAEVGFPVGIAIFIGPILYIKKWREWYYYQLEKMIVKFIHWQNCKRIERRTRRRRANITQRH